MLYSPSAPQSKNYSKCGLHKMLSSIATHCHNYYCYIIIIVNYCRYFCRFPCHFLTFALLFQVTWIYEPKEGERTNIAVLHPKFQPNYPNSPVKGRVSFSELLPRLNSPSIQIRDVRMNDEGKYICEYATYPSGNEQGITKLVMLGKSLIMFLHFSN